MPCLHAWRRPRAKMWYTIGLLYQVGPYTVSNKGSAELVFYSVHSNKEL